MLALVVLLAAAPSSAVDGARPESWKFELDLHGWVPEQNVTLTTGDELTIGIGDVLSEFDATFQGLFKARKDRWRLFAEALYVNLTNDDVGTVTRPVGRLGIPAEISVDYSQKTWIVTAGVGYNLIDEDRWTLDVFGGLRYTWLHVGVGFDFETRLLDRPIELDGRRMNLDGIVAGGGGVLLGDRWYARYYADVGTGDTDLTWTAQGVVAYRFASVDAYAGWRYQEWNGIGDDLIRDASGSGPIVGVRFRF
jgi:hypothetical protein